MNRKYSVHKEQVKVERRGEEEAVQQVELGPGMVLFFWPGGGEKKEEKPVQHIDGGGCLGKDSVWIVR